MVKWITLFLIKRELKKLLKEMDAGSKTDRYVPLISGVIVQAQWRYVGDYMYPYISVYRGRGVFVEHVFIERSRYEFNKAALSIYELMISGEVV